MLRPLFVALSFASLVLAQTPREMPDGFDLPAGANYRFGNRQLRHPGRVIGSAVSPDGKYLATVSDRNVVIWDLQTLKAKRIIPTWRNYEFTGSLDFLNGSQSVLSSVQRVNANSYGSRVDYAQVWTIETGKGDFSLRASDLRDYGSGVLPFKARSSEDGREIASFDPGCIRYYDAKTGQYLRQVPLQDLRWRHDTTPEWSPVHDAKTGKVLWHLRNRDVHFHRRSPDGKVVVWFDSKSKTIHVRDLMAQSEIAAIEQKDFHIYDLVITRDYKTLYAMDEKNRFVRWDIGGQRQVFATPFPRHRDAYFQRHLSADEKTLFAIHSETGVVYRLDTSTGKEIPLPTGGYATPPTMALTGDGKQVIVADQSGQIDFHDLATGRKVKEMPKQHFAHVDCLATSSDYRYLAMGLIDWKLTLHGRWPAKSWLTARVRLYDQTTGRVVWETVPDTERGIEHFFEHFTQLAFDRDSNILLAATHDRLHTLAVASGGVLSSTASRLTRFAADPNGRWFAGTRISGLDSELEWEKFDPTTGKVLQRVTAQSVERNLAEEVRMWPGDANLSDLVATPDGSHLITAHEDGSVRWWDPETGNELHRGLPKFREGMTLAISSDGRYLAIAGRYSPEILIWETATRNLVHTLRGNLSPSTQLLFTRDGKGLITNADMAPTLWSLAPNQLPTVTEEEAWRTLASTDAAKAYAMQWALAARPEVAVKLFSERIKPADFLVDRAELDGWVKSLDSPRFAVREAAEKEMSLKSSRFPRSWLTAASTAATSDEVRTRLQRVQSANDKGGDPTAWRLARAASVLRWTNTDEARALLKTWGQ